MNATFNAATPGLAPLLRPGLLPSPRWVMAPTFGDPARQLSRETLVAAIHARMRQQIAAHQPERIDRARYGIRPS